MDAQIMTDSGLYLPTQPRPGEGGIREWIFKAATIWNNRLSGIADLAAAAQAAADAAQVTATTAVDQIPVTGDFRLMASSSYGSEWLPCDGAAVSRATYADLFTKIGETYGAGDGYSTFNLPTIKAFILDNSTGFSLDTLEKTSWTIVIRT